MSEELTRQLLNNQQILIDEFREIKANSDLNEEIRERLVDIDSTLMSLNGNVNRIIVSLNNVAKTNGKKNNSSYNNIITFPSTVKSWLFDKFKEDRDSVISEFNLDVADKIQEIETAENNYGKNKKMYLIWDVVWTSIDKDSDEFHACSVRYEEEKNASYN